MLLGTLLSCRFASADSHPTSAVGVGSGARAEVTVDLHYEMPQYKLVYQDFIVVTGSPDMTPGAGCYKRNSNGPGEFGTFLGAQCTYPDGRIFEIKGNYPESWQVVDGGSITFFNDQTQKFESDPGNGTHIQKFDSTTGTLTEINM